MPEQLKAVFKDTDKTPCAREKLSPDKDLVLRQECVSESAGYLYTYKRQTVRSYVKEDPNATISQRCPTDFTVTVVAVEMCRKRDLNIGTSISNLPC